MRAAPSIVLLFGESIICTSAETTASVSPLASPTFGRKKLGRPTVSQEGLPPQNSHRVLCARRPRPTLHEHVSPHGHQPSNPRRASNCTRHIIEPARQERGAEGATQRRRHVNRCGLSATNTINSPPHRYAPLGACELRNPARVIATRAPAGLLQALVRRGEVDGRRQHRCRIDDDILATPKTRPTRDRR